MLSSKAKIKTSEEVEDGPDSKYMLTAEPGRWLRDENGDLGWTYTTNTVRQWSNDELLTHLWENTFSVPARDYNPGAPFVYIKFDNGEIVTLPHGYRLPLAFVAKYMWKTTLAQLKSDNTWKKDREAIFHISRLCENLFQQARAKAFTGGMGKGWRCEMFDRLLTRFYKHWCRNDPQGVQDFTTKYSPKEYDRDVLKHDWKRWCQRGLGGARMTEDEILNGMSISDYRKSLSKGEDGTWFINGESLTFISEYAWSSTSELTDYDEEEEIEQVVPKEEEEECDGTAEGDIDRDVVMIPSESSKRYRDEVEENDRDMKRSRMGSTEGFNTRRRSLKHTLAAMQNNPIWAKNSSAPVLTSKVAGPSSRPLSSISDTGSGDGSDDVIIISGPSTRPSKNSVKKHPISKLSKKTTISSSNSSVLPKKPSKPRLTRAAQIAGVATVNLYISDGKHGAPTVTSAKNKWQASTTGTRKSQRYNVGRSAQKRECSRLRTTSPVSDETIKSPRRTSVALLDALEDQEGSHGAIEMYAYPRQLEPSIRLTTPPPEPLVMSILTPGPTQATAPDRESEISLASPLHGTDDPCSTLHPSPSLVTDISISSPVSTCVNPSQLESTLLVPPVSINSRSPSPLPRPSSTPPQQEPPPPPLPSQPTLPQPILLPLAAISAFPTVAINEPGNSLETTLTPHDMPTSAPSSNDITQSTTATISNADITSKALELLVNLIDTKQILENKLPRFLSSSTFPTSPAQPSHSTRQPTSAVGFSREDHERLERWFHDFEDQFSLLKEELGKTVERLQALEKKAKINEQLESSEDDGKWRQKEREMVDVAIESSFPERTSIEVQTEDVGTSEQTKWGKDITEDVDMDGPQTGAKYWNKDVTTTEESVSPPSCCEVSVQTDSTLEPATPLGDDEKELQSSNTSSGTLSGQQTLGELPFADQSTHHSSGSEADTEATLNTNLTYTNSLSKEESFEPRVRAMSSNLSMFVDNLVSTKMLSLMENMLSSKARGATSMSDPHSTDLPLPPPVVSSVTSNPFLVVNLLEELKTLKAEVRDRDRRDREELEEMRRLHVAEVDALRRRLSYIESQNRYLDSQASSTSSISKYHGSSVHPGPIRDYRNNFSLDNSSGKSFLPTPTPSERSFTFTRPDGDDELPLPIKSQRKNFPRLNFGS